MDVTGSGAGRLRGWALARPHVAVLAAPQRQTLGWHVEAAVAARGWSLSVAPADTDVLVVAAEPEHLHPVLLDATRRWWHHLGSPRAQVDVHDVGQVAQALDRARALLDRDLRPRPDSRSDEVATLLAERDRDRGTGHDTGGHDAGHGTGGHGDHDPGSVAGLPMAGTGEDRDGLALDVLAHRLGPFLAGWPAGLVVTATLSGDVVLAAEVEHRPDRSEGEVVPRAAAVAHALGAVLELASWPAASEVVKGARLHLLEGGDLTPVQRRWVTRVLRSRTLGWVLRDIGSHDGRDAADRLREWCSELLATPSAAAVEPGWSLVPDPEVVEHAVVGTELARARIAVASLALTAAEDADAAPGAAARAHGRAP